MTSPVDVVRVNQATWSWTSCSFTVDGMSTEGIVGLDYDEQLEVRIIPSNVQDQLPLGMSLGRYQVGRFPLRMLRDAALAFKRYLTTKALTAHSVSYGQATFDLGLQLSHLDAPDSLPSTTVFASCRVVGERTTHEEGIEAAVTEFQIATLAIVQDGTSLWEALGASAAMPWTDTITIGGLPAPGKWTLLRAPKKFGWDVKKAYATSGATIVATGDELIVARFLVEIWTVTDYLAFQLFRSTYLKKSLVAIPGGGLTGVAIGIGHPELKGLGAVNFVPQEVNPLVNDGFGVGMAEVEFLQFYPPKPVLGGGKPVAAIPDASPPGPTAENQVDVELQIAEAQLQGLAK